mmetsp:Transcript_23892/g.36785  ORF Transcript_23892/g.36785 Transcript_23892/m.36785 type:complete len:539 (-) Transcript_23892:593-2209(-)
MDGCCSAEISGRRLLVLLLVLLLVVVVVVVVVEQVVALLIVTILLGSGVFSSCSASFCFNSSCCNLAFARSILASCNFLLRRFFLSWRDSSVSLKSSVVDMDESACFEFLSGLARTSDESSSSSLSSREDFTALLATKLPQPPPSPSHGRFCKGSLGLINNFSLFPFALSSFPSSVVLVIVLVVLVVFVSCDSPAVSLCFLYSGAVVDDASFLSSTSREELQQLLISISLPSSSSSSLHRDNDNGNGNSYKKRLVVEHGRPFAQMYGFGDGWRRRHRFNMTELLGPDSPALLVTQEEAEAYYPAGPPYIATAKDTKKIVWLWSEIMFRGYEQYADLLTEMYCYCMAAAHLRLPHVILTSLMVSDTSIHSGEGWKFIEQMPKHNVCELARRQRHNDGVDDDVATRDGNNFVYPSVMHYCQDYAVGDKWYFQKRYLPNNYFECDGPYLEEPPMDVATRYDYSTVPHRDRKEGSNLVLRNAFAVCAITSMANQAVRHYKERTCGTTFNKKFVNYYQFEMNGQQFPPEAIMMDDENEETERR